MPIVGKPFERIAMVIVGSLSLRKSFGESVYSGYVMYILVICDYVTRYPKAMPLWSIEAEIIVEELVKTFFWVGLLEDILTDQANFISLLLKEIYWLLHIKVLQTSLCHPKTDGLV